MIVLISLLSLWLCHLVSSQLAIETQEEARRIACNLATDGLSGDTECALANARFVLVTNGFQQTISTADLNQICGPTTCADLVQTTISVPCIREGDPVIEAAISANQRRMVDLVCTSTNETRSCAEFIPYFEFQALNMSFRDSGVCNATTTPICPSECTTLLSNFINIAGCCARELIDYKRQIGQFGESAISIFTRCGIDNAPNDCQNLMPLFRSVSTSSGVTASSLGTFGAMILLMLITAIIAI